MVIEGSGIDQGEESYDEKLGRSNKTWKKEVKKGIRKAKKYKIKTET